MRFHPTPRITAVVSAFEQRHFFPDGLASEARRQGLPTITVHDPAQIENHWPQFIAESQPSVIIGGWDLPPLPPRSVLPASISYFPNYLCYLAGSVRGKVPRDWIEHGLVVSNWGGSISHVVAESALMMILSALRCVADSQHRLHRPTEDWRHPSRPERSLFRRRVGIHGFGKVAQSLMPLLKPFNVCVRSYAPGTPDAVLGRFDVETCHSLQELFEWSEVFVEAAPLNSQTQGVVDAKLLRRLQQGAVFVNIGRGQVVIEDDLLSVAKEKDLRLALDVFETEPLPADSPLRKDTEILLMPHQSGPTLDSCRDAGTFALQQVSHFLNGNRPESAIDLAAWDSIT